MRIRPTRPASRAGTVPQRGRAGRPEGRHPAAARARRRRAKCRCRRSRRWPRRDPLNRRVVEQMLVGVATRQYARSLEPLPAGDGEPRARARAASAAASSRKTTAQLAAWQTAPLDGLDLVALLIDGVHIGEHCLIVALGIAADGQKHALGLWDGVDRERDRVSEPARESPEPRAAHRPQPAGDPRWLEGAAQSGARDLRRGRARSSGARSTSSATSSTTCRSGSGPWVQAIVRRAYQADRRQDGARGCSPISRDASRTSIPVPPRACAKASTRR